MNYDPNLVTCGQMATQRVRLTFGSWDYRVTKEVEVGGNCLGMTVIDCAIGMVYDSLPGGDYPEIELGRENGDTLLCSDDERMGEDWLKDMLVGAEIVAISAGWERAA